VETEGFRKTDLTPLVEKTGIIPRQRKLQGLHGRRNTDLKRAML
jgi:hypothetical protein